MAVKAQTHPTILDHLKRMSPDGKIGPIAEMLVEDNPILEDMVYLEGNLPNGHQTTVRTGTADAHWRRANKGIPNSKGSTAQVMEACARLESRSEIDVVVADLNGNRAAYRASQQIEHVQGIRNKKANALFYGNNTANPEQFNGLAERYSDLSAENSKNIVLGEGASTDNTSIWMVCWGPQTVHGIYPKGKKPGLVHQDLGEGDAFDADNNRFRALMDLWSWECGLALVNWQYVVRIANIPMSTLVASDASAPDLTALMTIGLHKIKQPGMGRMAIYANPTVVTYLDLQRQGKVAGGGGLNYENVDGKNVLTFRGIPIRVCDGILNTEELVA